MLPAGLVWLVGCIVKKILQKMSKDFSDLHLLKSVIVWGAMASAAVNCP